MITLIGPQTCLVFHSHFTNNMANLSKKSWGISAGHKSSQGQEKSTQSLGVWTWAKQNAPIWLWYPLFPQATPVLNYQWFTDYQFLPFYPKKWFKNYTSFFKKQIWDDQNPMFCLDQLKEPKCVSNSCFFRHRITQVDGSQFVPRIDTNLENSYKLFLEFVKETVKKPYITYKKKLSSFAPQKMTCCVFFLEWNFFFVVYFFRDKTTPHQSDEKVRDPRSEVRDFLFRRLCSSLPSKRHENLDEYRSMIRMV